jgi:hypothetical protein
VDKGTLWKGISIVGIALSLLVTVGLVLGQAASPEAPIALTGTDDGSVGGSSQGVTTAGDSLTAPDQSDSTLAPAAPLDDGFWYQGRLTGSSGKALANTNVNVTFRLYDAATGGTALDSTVVTVNTDGNGLFNEEIDFNNATLFNGQALYLGLQVDGEPGEMTPRQYLRPVPYALSINPGAVIRGSIQLGDLGAHGYLYVHDLDDVEVLDFSGSTAYLRLGGAGEDGDLVIYNMGPTTTFQVDGLQGHVYVYDGVDDTPDHRLFEFDSTYRPAEGHSTGAIWGDQTDNLGNLTLMSNDDVDVYLEQTNPGGTVGEFRIHNGAGTVVYSITEDGATSSAGTKSALVDTADYGERTLYAMESPEVWFEDFGTAQLANGQATVTLEPLFLQTINTGVPYHVFVTPLGDCNGLYVTNKTAISFEVRELGGGTANIGFDYRIVAKRLGFVDLRLPTPGSLGAEVPGPGGRPGASVPAVEPEPAEGQQ